MHIILIPPKLNPGVFMTMWGMPEGKLLVLYAHHDVGMHDVAWSFSASLGPCSIGTIFVAASKTLGFEWRHSVLPSLQVFEWQLWPPCRFEQHCSHPMGQLQSLSHPLNQLLERAAQEFWLTCRDFSGSGPVRACPIHSSRLISLGEIRRPSELTPRTVTWDDCHFHCKLCLSWRLAPNAFNRPHCTAND